MSAAHTPGPWVAHASHQKGRAAAAYYIDRVGGGDKRSRAVAHVKNSTIQPTAANARLIAAAPELLDALEFALRDMEATRAQYAAHFPNIGVLAITIATARAAIAKATGSAS